MSNGETRDEDIEHVAELIAREQSLDKIGGGPKEVSDAIGSVQDQTRETIARLHAYADGDYSDMKLGDTDDLTDEEAAQVVASQRAIAEQVEFDRVVAGEFPDDPQIHVV